MPKPRAGLTCCFTLSARAHPVSADNPVTAADLVSCAVAHDVAMRASAAGWFPATDVPMIPVSGLDADPAEIERAAKQARAQWGIVPGPLPDVLELLETHGITVISLPLGSSDVDAFSLPFADHPVVVLGTDKDDRARSRFDGAADLWPAPDNCRLAHTVRTQAALASLTSRPLSAIKTAPARGWRRAEPVPPGQPEQPNKLLGYLASPDSTATCAVLPPQILESIQTASRA